MDVCFFGGYDSGYPRNLVIRRGLEAQGVSVSECQVRPGQKFWLRYPLLLFRWLTVARKTGPPPSFLFVPEFCQKDVPLARLLAFLSSRRLVFDPLASRFETKIIDWRRKPEGSLAAWWNKMIDRRAFRAADLVLADTQPHKEYYCRMFGLSPQKVEVLPVGFDDEIFTKSLAKHGRHASNDQTGFTVLFFGSFLPLHGVETVVQAASLLANEDRTVNFLLIGSGQTLPRVKHTAAELGLANVRYEGWTGQASLASRVAAEADLCLGIFGRTEKAGRVVPHKIFQALALRKPVVTARTPAVEAFFSHRQNIYLCREGDAHSLAGAILELRKDQSLREGIAEKGYELAWEKYYPRAIGAVLMTNLTKHFG